MGKVVLAVAFAGILCACGRHPGASPTECAELTMRNFQGAIEMYYLRNHRMPEALETLTEEDSVTGEPWMTSIPDDPWGSPYRYRPLGGTKFEILSFGEDTMEGTDDDILRPPPQ